MVKEEKFEEDLEIESEDSEELEVETESADGFEEEEVEETIAEL